MIKFEVKREAASIEATSFYITVCLVHMNLVGRWEGFSWFLRPIL